MHKKDYEKVLHCLVYACFACANVWVLAVIVTEVETGVLLKRERIRLDILVKGCPYNGNTTHDVEKACMSS